MKNEKFRTSTSFSVNTANISNKEKNKYYLSHNLILNQNSFKRRDIPA